MENINQDDKQKWQEFLQKNIEEFSANTPDITDEQKTLLDLFNNAVKNASDQIQENWKKFKDDFYLEQKRKKLQKFLNNMNHSFWEKRMLERGLLPVKNNAFQSLQPKSDPDHESDPKSVSDDDVPISDKIACEPPQQRTPVAAKV